ncbi:MAG: hypothetical protein ABIH86_07110 [Planctomycetota bacterium]
MSNAKKDIGILRALAEQCREIAGLPIQNERRELWNRHFSNQPTSRPPMIARFGMWNVWCKELFGDSAMECADPFYREYERQFRLKLFHSTVGDDEVFEPWITVRAVVGQHPDGVWGVKQGSVHSDEPGGAVKYVYPLKRIEDWRQMSATPHTINEAETKRKVEKLSDAIGDIMTINVNRAPLFSSWNADISTLLGHLRGIENFMVDMLDNPDELHAMLAFMRDSILANQKEAEDAGDWGLCNHENQAVQYCGDLKPPAPNQFGVKRNELFVFFAAQEYTGVSPRMHDEFLLQYQKPIIENFALAHYGCCEDLTRKIKMLRQLKNLRSIAVTPSANVKLSAEQIGSDYVASWRPNPTDMVCGKFDTTKIRAIIKDGHSQFKANHCNYHINLKDVETLEGDNDRMRRWFALVKECVSE